MKKIITAAFSRTRFADQKEECVYFGIDEENWFGLNPTAKAEPNSRKNLSNQIR